MKVLEGNDNPDLYDFGYNSNIIRMQRSIAPVAGNSGKVPFLGFQLTMHLLQNDIKTNDLLMIQKFLTQNLVKNAIFFTKMPVYMYVCIYTYIYIYIYKYIYIYMYM